MLVYYILLYSKSHHLYVEFVKFVLQRGNGVVAALCEKVINILTSYQHIIYI